jgi:hypothetical protein
VQTILVFVKFVADFVVRWDTCTIGLQSSIGEKVMFGPVLDISNNTDQAISKPVTAHKL